MYLVPSVQQNFLKGPTTSSPYTNLWRPGYIIRSKNQDIGFGIHFTCVFTDFFLFWFRLSFLDFIFDKHTYNVLEVNKTSYENCNDQGFIQNITRGGRDVFQLTEARPYYFLSSGGYCYQGMKVAVPVEAPVPTQAPEPAKNGSPSNKPSRIFLSIPISMIFVLSILLNKSWRLAKNYAVASPFAFGTQVMKNFVCVYYMRAWAVKFCLFCCLPCKTWTRFWNFLIYIDKLNSVSFTIFISFQIRLCTCG